MSYESLVHTLATKMLQAASLQEEVQQTAFVRDTFVWIVEQKNKGQLSHKEYLRLVEKLAGYKDRAYDDYLDLLVGAAGMQLLEIYLANEGENPAGHARQRSGLVDTLTGGNRVPPEEE